MGGDGPELEITIKIRMKIKIKTEARILLGNPGQAKPVAKGDDSSGRVCITTMTGTTYQLAAGC